MDIAMAALLSLILMGASARMIRSHLTTWRAVRDDPDLEPRERDYRRRQFRRRLQTSVMLGILGIALLVGQFLQPPVPRVVVLTYWAGVLLVVFWMVLLAVADIISIRMFFGRMRNTYLIEQTRLRAELRRAERIHGNGREKTEERRER